jgi:hypothetical protein
MREISKFLHPSNLNRFKKYPVHFYFCYYRKRYQENNDLKKIYGVQFRFEFLPEESNKEDEGDFETVRIKKYRELISSILRISNLELTIEKKKVVLV